MNKEVEELLNKLGEMEDAPLIWINKKIYEQTKKIDDLQQRIDKAIEFLDKVREENGNEIGQVNYETLIEILGGKE